MNCQSIINKRSSLKESVDYIKPDAIIDVNLGYHQIILIKKSSLVVTRPMSSERIETKLEVECLFLSTKV